MGQEGCGRREKKDKKGREVGSQRGREAGEKFKKESVCNYYCFTAYDPLKNMKPVTYFRLPFNSSETLNKILHAKKRKFVLGLILVKLEIFRGRFRHRW